MLERADVEVLIERGRDVGAQAIMKSTRSVDLKELKTTTFLHLIEAIESTIVIMEDENDAAQELLESFNGKICGTSDSLIDELKRRSPKKFTAKVGDFNDNLEYAMQNGRGLLSGDENRNDNEHFKKLIIDFESSLRIALDCGDKEISYQGSFLHTEKTMPQPAHVDFTWETLELQKENLFLAFFPLTRDGMFLQVWKEVGSQEETSYGKVVFIPYGKMLILPSDTIHGGGFKSSYNGNLRYHLYIAIRGTSLPTFQNNKYTEKHNRGLDMSDRFKDALGLNELVGSIFYD